MTTQLKTLLKLKKGEARPAFVLFWYYFMVVTVSIMGRSASRSIFLSTVDNAESVLPLVLIAVALTSSVVAAGYGWLSRRMNLVPLIMTVSVFFAVTLSALTVFLDYTPVIIAMFIWLEVIATMGTVQFFLLSSSIFTTRQAKRIYGLTGAGGAIAGLISGLALRPITNSMGTRPILYIASGAMIIVAVLAWLAGRYIHAPEGEDGDARRLGKKQERLNFDGYLIAITTAVALMIIVATTVEYQFNIVMLDAIPDQDQLTVFFGSFFAVIGVLQLLIRLFVVSRVLERSGILAGLLSLPGSMAIASLVMLLMPGPIAAILLKGTDQVFRYTITETSMELLWVPIPAAQRLRAKPIISGTVVSLFQGISGLLIFFAVLIGLRVELLSILLLIAIVLWVPVVLRLRQGYLGALTESLQQRNLEFEDVRIDSTDQTIVRTINKWLMTGNEVEQAFVLSMIDNLILDPWSDTLHDLFTHSDSDLIRAQLVRMTEDYPAIISDVELLALVEKQDPIADEALRVAAVRHSQGLLPLLEANFYTEDTSMRAAIMEAICILQEGPVDKAIEELKTMLDAAEPGAIIAGLTATEHLPLERQRVLLTESRILRLLAHDLVGIRQQSIILMLPDTFDMKTPNLIDAMARNLPDPAIEELTRRQMRLFPSETVIDVLTTIYRDGTEPIDLQVAAIRALADYPTGEVAVRLGQDLQQAHIMSLSAAMIDTLLAISRRNPLPPTLVNDLAAQRWEIAVTAYRSYKYLDLLGEKSANYLMRELIRGDLNESLPLLLKLSVLDQPDTDIESILKQVLSDDRTRQSNALEILDNVLKRDERDMILPLLDGRSITEIIAEGPRHVGKLPRNMSDVTKQWIISPDEWRAVVALDYAMRYQRFDVLLTIDWETLPNTHPNADQLKQYLQDIEGALQELSSTGVIKLYNPVPEGRMYSTLELTIILKNSDLFGQIPSKQLYYLAQIVEEQVYEANQPIFNEGDEGDSMYIISEGSVRIHLHGRELTVLHTGQSVGELALMDKQPRSAGATAAERTVLLRLSARDFNRVTATNPNIMSGAVRVLAQRLRATNERLLATRDRGAVVDTLLDQIDKD